MDSTINTTFSNVNTRSLSIPGLGVEPRINPPVSTKTEAPSATPPLSQPQDTISLSGTSSSIGSSIELPHSTSAFDSFFPVFTPPPITVEGTEKGDKVSVALGENGSFTVTVNGEVKTYTQEEALRLKFALGDGDNVFTADPRIKSPLSVMAGDGNNAITGGSGSNIITVGDGDNHILTGSGSDSIKLGHGNNHVETEAVKAEPDLFSSSLSFNDSLMMAANLPDSYRQRDMVFAGDGNNIIQTGSGDDLVKGGHGNNSISTFAGKDYVLAGSGNNQISTGEGDDIVDILSGETKIGISPNGAITTGVEEKAGSATGTNNIDLGPGNDAVLSGSGIDNILAGEGNDSVNAGGGDNIIDAGSGNDLVYAFEGNDLIKGGAGKDFISSGDGNDKVFGGDGDDVISSGSGSDILHGGSGKNTIVAKDRLTEGEVISGAAKLFDGADLLPSAGEKIKISGDPNFTAQVKADLETLRQIPGANKLLQALDASGKKVEITADFGEFCALPTENSADVYALENGTPGKGSDGKIFYDPQLQYNGGEHSYKPLTSLYHELVHVYNYVTGTMLPGVTTLPDGQTVNTCENQAVGLTGTEVMSVKHPDGKEYKGNPPEFTENYILETLGLPLRASYLDLFADK